MPRTVYHIYLDTDESGKPVPVILEKEPSHHQGAWLVVDDTRTYYIYAAPNLHPLILIEIGRAVERHERGSVG